MFGISSFELMFPRQPRHSCSLWRRITSVASLLTEPVEGVLTLFLLSLRCSSCYLTRQQNCSLCCSGRLEPHPCACRGRVLRQKLRVTLSRRVWLRCLTRQHGKGAELPCPVKCLPATLIIKCFMSTPQHVRPVTRGSDHHTLSPSESLPL